MNKREQLKEFRAALEWIATSDHPDHPEFGDHAPERPRLEHEWISRLQGIARNALAKVDGERADFPETGGWVR